MNTCFFLNCQGAWPPGLRFASYRKSYAENEVISRYFPKYEREIVKRL